MRKELSVSWHDRRGIQRKSSSAGSGWCLNRAAGLACRTRSRAARRDAEKARPRAEIDAGKREGMSTQEREEIRKLRRENFELRRATRS